MSADLHPLTPAEVDAIEARSKVARERFMANPPKAAAPEAVWPSLDDVPRLVAYVRKLREALWRCVIECDCPGAELNDRRHDCACCRQDRALLG